MTDFWQRWQKLDYFLFQQLVTLVKGIVNSVIFMLEPVQNCFSTVQTLISLLEIISEWPKMISGCSQVTKLYFQGTYGNEFASVSSRKKTVKSSRRGAKCTNVARRRDRRSWIFFRRSSTNLTKM